jgi:hypothetical protein
MNNAFLFLLMLVLPLQSLWAAGQGYHILEEGHSTGAVAVLLSHVHEHEHAHDHAHSNSHEDHSSNSDSASESDHHHHCAGHCAVVLPSPLTNLQPNLRYQEFSPEPTLASSYLNSRIERPNWC